MEAILKMEGKLYEKALQICKDEHKAKDAVQETFLWVIENNIYETKGVMDMLVKLAMKQLNFREVFVPTVNDEEYESVSAGFQRSMERVLASKEEAPIPDEDRVMDRRGFVLRGKLGRKMLYMKYPVARAYMHRVGLKNRLDWYQWCRDGNRPKFIPAGVEVFYGKQWGGWVDFLGTNHYDFAPFDEAREFARKLGKEKGVTSFAKWLLIVHTIPPGIPRAPQSWYAKRGEWTSWPDFLGTNNKRPPKVGRELVDYDKAKLYTQEHLVPLGITSLHQWVKNGELIPDFLPKSCPSVTYKGKGWIDSKDFFGIEPQQDLFTERDFISYKDAREWIRLNVRICGVNSKLRFDQWKSGIIAGPAIPDNIPKRPDVYYKSKGTWVSWRDFTGDLTRKEKGNEIHTPPFDKFIAWTRVAFAGFVMNSGKWIKFYNNHLQYKDIPRPDFHVPLRPEITYKNKGWVSWMHLTYNTEDPRSSYIKKPLSQMKGLARKKLTSKLSFEDAKEWVMKNLVPIGINGQVAFKNYNDLPAFIPTCPDQYYKKKWKGWPDFFGRDSFLQVRKKVVFIEYSKARELLISHGVRTRQEYSKRSKKINKLLPSQPWLAYGDKWVSWMHFLGNEDKAGRGYRLKQVV